MRSRSFSISESTTLAAGVTSPNLLAGTRLNPVIEPGMLSIWAVGSVAGVEMKMLVQSDEICSGFRISGANRYPVKDQDWAIVRIPVNRGDVVNLTFTDAPGAGATVQWVIAFSPAGSAAGL